MAFDGGNPISAALPPQGRYRYEIRRDGGLIGVEEASFAEQGLRGSRRSSDGLNRYEVESRLDSGLIAAASVRYERGPFKRSASYEASGDLLRGYLIAAGGREEAGSKLGRMREVDCDLILCKALIVAHVRMRGQTLWIGRVATIDPNTLLVSSPKQTYRRAGDSARLWIFEPRMGDTEQIEIDDAGRVICRRSRDGTEMTLIDFIPSRQA
jgi:hypothetical protein